MGAGPGGEDVEDDLGAVEHLQAQGPLEVSRLGRREVVVEDHHVGVVMLHQLNELGELALAEVGGLIGMVPPLHDLGHHGCTRRGG